MSNLLSSLTTINTSDPDVRRRGRNLVILAVGMATLALIFIPFSSSQTNRGVVIPILLVLCVTFFGIAFIARAGYVTTGAWLLIGTTVTAILGLMASSLMSATEATGFSGVTTPYFLVLAILLAGVLLPPVHIWSALGASLLGLALTVSLTPMLPSSEALVRQNATNSSLMLVMVALISFVSARGIKMALTEADEARRLADEAGKHLAATNAALEQRVEERTAALRQIADEHRAAASALAASLEAQQDLNRIITAQAIPVIPVSEGTLVVPLIGNVGSERADQILSTVLTHVERTHAQTVVLDVTGVAVVDTHVASGLLRVAQATRLMGTATVLAGIRPEVAQSLVGLGVDLADLRTVATLKEAL